MKKTILKTGLCFVAASCIIFNTATFNAAKTPTINHKSKTITSGKSANIKVSNATKKVTWSSSKNKVVKIIKTSGKNACKVKIKGLKKGTATITAKIGSKKLKCKVTVKKASNNSGKYYITDTGSKYHISSCRTLKKSKIAISLSEATTSGYTPCGICLK